MEPSAVSVTRLDGPELRALVQDVTRTAGMFLRLVRIDFPAASDEEADAIAAPAARMLAKAPAVQRVIRKVADPVVLTGAVVYLLFGRPARAARLNPFEAPKPPAPTPPAPTQEQPVSKPPGIPVPPTPTIPPSVPIVDPAAVAMATEYARARETAYRESILDGIARADVR